ncbi:MAG: transcriptional repressor [Cyanomargarita calcarea GSE-NOS-MK-12-04C]|uniref:Transcriptional repressor n=1 Tax=Cyanomargarita calcarea GSE-NOS-MK-12-04C TaxID=2839659 RepID=A0A951QKB5_9CYAN|nr:transcriptional repressor [Cyanomargarita calcarea GSE-NOS-MK-12-04C]
MRLTPQREKIYFIFQNLPPGNHLNAEQIWDYLIQDGEKISLSTVYRSLKLMTRMGILRELEFAEGHKKYELNVESAIHHHIVCIVCNQTIEFEDNLVIKQSLKQVQESGFKLVDCQLILHSICPEAVEMGWPASLPENWLCSRCVKSSVINQTIHKPIKKIKLRIEFKGERVALYVPDELNQSETFRTNAKSITGWRYCRNDFGWYYPLDKAVEALNHLFSLYDTEPELENIIALIEQQRVEVCMGISN